MKTIEQLLFLSKNPYYKLRPEEQQVLDDFLSQKQAEESKTSRKKSSKKSARNTSVRVKNIVDKTIDYPLEVHSGAERQFVTTPDGLPEHLESDNPPTDQNVS